MNRRSFLRLTAGSGAAWWIGGGAFFARPGAACSAELNIRQDFIPDGKFGRHMKIRLRPTYITVHSTGSRGGTAAAHARLLREGKIRAKTRWNTRGYNFWHFTVDDKEIVQHLPLNETGEHADHEGPGNMKSIGIEICEFSESARQRAAISRCARLVASLQRQFRIRLDHVVPHYHWTMVHYNNWHKPCPRILMDHGKPGPRWDAFLRMVSAA